MELAGRGFDSLIRNSPDEARRVFGDEDGQRRWRQTARVSGLLHDVGHAPFSHAGDDLFVGEVRSHEDMSVRLIRSGEIATILQSEGTFRMDPDEIARIAAGDFELGAPQSEAELVVKELIAGDLGVDRMDYLRRDSHMCGVAYGIFDLPRLVSTLMLTKREDGSPRLAIESGGMHAGEGLITARYFMFSQVYFHAVRDVYDAHLLRFLRGHLEEGRYPSDETYLEWDDIRVFGLMRGDREDVDAAAILNRKHFRRVEELTIGQLRQDPDLPQKLTARFNETFGNRVIVRDSNKSAVSMQADQIMIVDRKLEREDDILNLSGTLQALTPVRFVRVFSSVEDKEGVREMVREFLQEHTPHGGNRDE